MLLSKDVEEAIPPIVLMPIRQLGQLARLLPCRKLDMKTQYPEYEPPRTTGRAALQ